MDQTKVKEAAAKLKDIQNRMEAMTRSINSARIIKIAELCADLLPKTLKMLEDKNRDENGLRLLLLKIISIERKNTSYCQMEEISVAAF